MEQPSVVIGQVISIQFHREDTHFYIFKIQQPDGPLTIKGECISLNPGCQVKAFGAFTEHEVYGRQFAATHIDNLGPSTRAGLIKYLSSNLIKGIGAKHAQMIVKQFGEKTLEILEQEPQRVLNIKGIGEKRQKQIIEALTEQKHINHIMIFLHSHGIGVGRATRLYQKYQANTIEVIRQNPYRLIQELNGFAFKSADKIALSIGMATDDPLRIQAAILDIFQIATQFGHCYLTTEQIQTKLRERIGIDVCVDTIIGDLVKEGLLASEKKHPQHFYLPQFLEVEIGVSHLLSTRNKPLLNPVDIVSPQENDIELSASQIDALRQLLSEQLVVLTGGPGVGKTTLIRRFIASVKASGRKAYLCAPTGKAAKRLSQSTGEYASTIHRLLKFDPATKAFVYNEQQPLKCDTLVIDEISMIDIHLMYDVLCALSPSSQLVLVGDPDQLPSVGAGHVLFDIIQSNQIPIARLHEIHRQSGASLIVHNAHRINQGMFPQKFVPDTRKDFDLIYTPSAQEVMDQIIRIIDKLQQKGYDPVASIQVLCPMIRGTVGTQSINIALQNHLNPHGKPINNYFRIGDKVIAQHNNYEKKIFNGDVGIIQDCIDSEVIIDFDHTVVSMSLDDLSEIKLAWATTIHKSQGSEYPVVIAPILISHYMLLERNLLYTAITRGKSRVFLITDKKALYMTLNTQKSHLRQTKLADRLQELAQNPCIEYDNWTD